MPNAFQDLIRLILDGEPVDANTVNRVLRSLDANARYLRDIFEAAALGEAIFVREQTVVSSLLVGQPAYYNANNEQWEPALATSGDPDDTGVVQLADSARVQAVVYSKQNDTLADLVLFGCVELDLSNSIVGTPSTGQYFLSGQTAGQLVQQSLPLGIPVLSVMAAGTTSGSYRVFVRPGNTDPYTGHQHYHFDLATEPAGTAVLADGTWSITVPDDSIEGWLPADHAVFGGLAPSGAKFGYNLLQSGLATLWPPLPVDNCYLEWEQGNSVDFGTGVPLGADGLVIVDKNGIWWLSDCEYEVPWETQQPTTTTTAAP